MISSNTFESYKKSYGIYEDEHRILDSYKNVTNRDERIDRWAEKKNTYEILQRNQQRGKKRDN